MKKILSGLLVLFALSAFLSCVTMTAEEWYVRGVYPEKAQNPVSALNRAIALKPDYAEAYYERGRYYTSGYLKTYYIYKWAWEIRVWPDYEKAIADFAEAIRLRPNYVAAYEARAKACEGKGDEVYRRSNVYVLHQEAEKTEDAVAAYLQAVADYEQVNQIIPGKISEETIAKLEEKIGDLTFWVSYDPADFVLPPPGDFRPSVNAAQAGLLDAMTSAEKMAPGWAGQYVSDLVFVSQTGTDIRFRTAENTTSKTMKLGVQVELTSGQLVRVWYTAYRTKDWQVEAIAQL